MDWSRNGDAEGQLEESARWRADVAAAYLGPLRESGRRLRGKKAELDEQRALLGGLRGIDVARPVAASAPSGGAVPESVARLMEMEESYGADLEELDARRGEARRCLDAMREVDRDADLLRLYYVSALPWSTVAEALNLAEGTCRNKRARALAVFYDFMPHHARPPEVHAI